MRIGKVVCLLWIVAITVMNMGVVFAAGEDKVEPLPSYRANSFEVIQKVSGDKIKEVYKTLTATGNNKHQFWEDYNKQSKKLSTAEQMATGVMNWDTIIAYAANIIEWISNLGLVVGALFIIYSGYQYAMSAFGMKEDNGKAIKNAFIGIAVIATSYGIFRLLVRVFIE